jgi:hypothetical protein
MQGGGHLVSTSAMGDAVIAALSHLATEARTR